MLLAVAVASGYQVNGQIALSPDQVRAVVWSPDGDRLAISFQSGQIKIISVAADEPPLVLPEHSAAIFALAWSPDSKYLAGGSSGPDNSLRVWNATSGQEVLTAPDVGQVVLTVAWKPDGSQIIAVAAEPLSSPNSAVLVNPASKRVTPLRIGSISDIRWSPDGTKVAMTGTSSVCIYDAGNFQDFSEYPIDQHPFRPGLQNQAVQIRWSPDGVHFAVAMGDGRLFLWQLGNSQPTFTLVSSDYEGTDRFLGWIYALRFDSSGQTLTSVSGNGTIRIWNVQSGAMLAEQKGVPNYAADFSPAGARVAFGYAPPTGTSQRPSPKGMRTFVDVGISILVLNPTTTGLDALASECKAPKSVTASSVAPITATSLSALAARIRSLPSSSMSKGCAADLVAVAQALQSP